MSQWLRMHRMMQPSTWELNPLCFCSFWYRWCYLTQARVACGRCLSTCTPVSSVPQQTWITWSLSSWPIACVCHTWLLSQVILGCCGRDSDFIVVVIYICMDSQGKKNKSRFYHRQQYLGLGAFHTLSKQCWTLVPYVDVIWDLDVSALCGEPSWYFLEDSGRVIGFGNKVYSLQIQRLACLKEYILLKDEHIPCWSTPCCGCCLEWVKISNSPSHSPGHSVSCSGYMPHPRGLTVLRMSEQSHHPSSYGEKSTSVARNVLSGSHGGACLPFC